MPKTIPAADRAHLATPAGTLFQVPRALALTYPSPARGMLLTWRGVLFT